MAERFLGAVVIALVCAAAGCKRSPVEHRRQQNEEAARTSDLPALQETALRAIALLGKAPPSPHDATPWTFEEESRTDRVWSRHAVLVHRAALATLTRTWWLRASIEAREGPLEATHVKSREPTLSRERVGKKRQGLTARSTTWLSILTVLGEEMVAPSALPIKAASDETLLSLAEANLWLEEAMTSFVVEAAAKSKRVDAEHVRAAYAALVKETGLRHPSEARQASEYAVWRSLLAPIARSLIEQRARANTDAVAFLAKHVDLALDATAFRTLEEGAMRHAREALSGERPPCAAAFWPTPFGPPKVSSPAYVRDADLANAIAPWITYRVGSSAVQLRLEPHPAVNADLPRAAADWTLPQAELASFHATGWSWSLLLRLHQRQAFAAAPLALEDLAAALTIYAWQAIRRAESWAKGSKVGVIDEPTMQQVLGPAMIPVAPPEGKSDPVPTSAAPAPLFRDVSKDSGLDIDHAQNAKPKPDPVSMGAGIAVGDMNADGYPDVFLAGAGGGRLFINRGKEKLRTFVDESDGWGVPRDLGETTSAVMFDMEGDGDLDLLLLRRERSAILLKQDAGGRLTDATARMRLAPRPGMHAVAVLDAEGDGDLDLVFGSYGPPAANGPSPQPSSDGLNGAPLQLFKLGSDGKYIDDTKRAGLLDVTGWVLSIDAVDLDNDGRLDLVTTGPFAPPTFLHNKGDGTFEFTDAVPPGVCGMRGMAIGDIDDDGDDDLLMSSHRINGQEARFIEPQGANVSWDRVPLDLQVQPNGPLFFVNPGKDKGAFARVSWPAPPRFGHGIRLFDYENDGDLDAYMTAGGIDGSPSATHANVMMLADRGRYTWASATSPEAFAGNSRAVVAFDIDADGDMDLLVSNQGRSPVLLQNIQSQGNHFVKLRLVAQGSNRNAIGAKVVVKTKTLTRTRSVLLGSGYMGQEDDVLTIGIGRAKEAEISVTWPNGKVQSVGKVTADKYREVKEP